MTSSHQTLLALAIVAATALAFVWRALRRRGRSGCGGDCGCATGGLKAKLRR